MITDIRELTGEIEDLLEEKDYRKLRSIMSELEPADAAEILDSVDEDSIPLLFRILPKEFAAECFVEMDSDHQEMLISAFSDNELATVIDNLFVDETVDILEEMPANVVKRVLHHADPEKRKILNQILAYPKDSAGAAMTTEFVELKAHMTADEVFKRIKRTGLDKETIYTCYVTDDRRKLIGVVTVKDFLTAQNEEATVGELMETQIISVSTTEDEATAAMMLSKYGFLALPVVDNENRLVGILTYDDAMEIIESEDTEDMEIMAGITPTDKPYLRIGIFETWWARIPWLLILMFSATFTSKILQHFEDALAAETALIAFIPMLMGTGGNAGGQVSVTIIRGLSLGEIYMRDILRVLWKELRVAILCGVTLAVMNFGKMLLVDDVTVTIAAIVSVTVVIAVVIAKLVGGILPILVKRIGLDPAVMASPFITTIVDALTTLIYFKIASMIIGL
ncbi:MAG: magnesium transporter [Clostridia bacterium]|nr:magnesium transporter [Clostridia bacterium]